jgi:hypothetical protein
LNLYDEIKDPLPPKATLQRDYDAAGCRRTAAGVHVPLRWLRSVGLLAAVATIAGTAGGCVPSMWGQAADVISVANAELPDAPGLGAGVEQESSATQTAGSISGVVVDSSGAAVAGARVTLSRDDEPGVKETLSGSDGRFTFSNVTPGEFKLLIAAAGYGARNMAGTVQAGQNLQLNEQGLTIAATTNDVTVTVSQQEVGELEVKAEEQQRVLGILPNFYVRYAPNPAPLSSKMKFELAWKTVIDPVTFALTGAVAGVEQANDTFPGFGQGASGYAKRYGAAYADGFIGTMIGSAILPSVLKQDPRYFYKGSGTIRSRALYAIANSVICKGDNGRWQANYSAILGGLAAAGISNLYYPASSRNGAGLTFENAAIGTAETAAANLLQEFLIRRLTPKAPKYTAP